LPRGGTDAGGIQRSRGAFPASPSQFPHATFTPSTKCPLGAILKPPSRFWHATCWKPTRGNTGMRGIWNRERESWVEKMTTTFRILNERECICTLFLLYSNFCQGGSAKVAKFFATYLTHLTYQRMRCRNTTTAMLWYSRYSPLISRGIHEVSNSRPKVSGAGSGSVAIPISNVGDCYGNIQRYFPNPRQGRKDPSLLQIRFSDHFC
jgi:hypothetical protein